MRCKCAAVVFVLVFAGLACCSGNDVIDNGSIDKTAPDAVIHDLSQTLVLRYGHTVFIEDEGLLIKFKGVTESRCPIGVQCIWEGQAIAEFLLVKPGEACGVARPIIRPSVGPDSDEFPKLADEALGYRLFLLALTPYPDIDRPVDVRDYVARVRIESRSD